MTTRIGVPVEYRFECLECRTLTVKLETGSTVELDVKDVQRFWGRVEDTGFCWVWKTGAISKYGRFRAQHRYFQAHRVAYELLVDEIPVGLQLDHLCRNTRCVNPDHLEPVTAAENTRRGYSTAAQHQRQTHCLRGHAFSPENTLTRPSGERKCRPCHAAGERRRRIAKGSSR